MKKDESKHELYSVNQSDIEDDGTSNSLEPNYQREDISEENFENELEFEKENIQTENFLDQQEYKKTGNEPILTEIDTTQNQIENSNREKTQHTENIQMPAENADQSKLSSTDNSQEKENIETIEQRQRRIKKLKRKFLLLQIALAVSITFTIITAIFLVGYIAVYLDNKKFLKRINENQHRAKNDAKIGEFADSFFIISYDKDPPVLSHAKMNRMLASDFQSYFAGENWTDKEKSEAAKFLNVQVQRSKQLKTLPRLKEGKDSIFSDQKQNVFCKLGIYLGNISQRKYFDNIFKAIFPPQWTDKNQRKLLQSIIWCSQNRLRMLMRREPADELHIETRNVPAPIDANMFFNILLIELAEN